MSGLEAGSVLAGRYHVEAKLGEGGMGVVYRAHDRRRRVMVALKMLKPDYAEDSSLIAKFRREARSLQRLQHPNIVRFYEVGEEGVHVYIVLDYIEGLTLRAIMRQLGQPLSPGEALGYLRAICAALSYAHSERIVHCDLKPANVMIDRTGRPFLSDFGIARLSESATTTLSAPGTPAYMAPEQWQAREQVGPPTDVYALGVVLYEMLTGRLPFTGGTVQTKGHTREKIMQEHLSAAPVPVSELNPRLPRLFDTIVLRCLEKDPAHRYQSASELLEAFEAACRQAGMPEVGVPAPDMPGSLPAASPSGPATVAGTSVPVLQPRAKPGLVLVGVGAAGIVLVAALLAAGGGLSLGSPTATPSPSATERPTRTSSATASPRPTATATATSTPTPVPQEISSGKSYSASRSFRSNPVDFAADGNPATWWSSGGPQKPAWWQVDFGAVYLVTRVELFVQQTPAGETHHNVYVISEDSTTQLVKSFMGYTQAGDVLTVDVPDGGLPARFLRVETVASPSWTAWAEVRVLGVPAPRAAGTGTVPVTPALGLTTAPTFTRAIPSATTAPRGPTREPNLGVLRLQATFVGVRPMGNGQCNIDFHLHATGGTGLYSYFRDKDIQDPEYKIAERHPGDFAYSMIRPNAWGGPVGFIVWSGYQSPQRASTAVWVDGALVQCP